MLSDVMEWLNTSLAAALGCVVTKGFPGWARTSNAPPIASVELWGLAARLSEPRVGAPLSLSKPPVRVILFAKDEPQLWEMAQALGSWLENNQMALVDSTHIRIKLDSSNRHDNLTGAEQERYALEFYLSITW